MHKLIGKGLYTKDIYLFEKQAEAILGAEIDPLRDYILERYRRDKDMYKLKFNEFQKVIQEWVEFEGTRAHFQENEVPEDYDSPTPIDDVEEYRKINRARDKLKQIIRMKVEKHADKIRDIFQIHSDEYQEKLKEQQMLEQQKLKEQHRLKEEQKSAQAKSKAKASVKSKKSEKSKKAESEKSEKSEKSDANESDKDKSDAESDDIERESIKASEKDNATVMPSSPSPFFQRVNVKLSKMDRVLNDIAYLTGLGLMTADEHTNKVETKKSSRKGINEFIHFVWWFKHRDQCDNIKYNSGSTYEFIISL